MKAESGLRSLEVDTLEMRSQGGAGDVDGAGLDRGSGGTCGGS